MSRVHDLSYTPPIVIKLFSARTMSKLYPALSRYSWIDLIDTPP